MKGKAHLIFIILGLSALVFGAFMGILNAIVYIYPHFFKDILPFNQLRPLHTTSVISWIILTATGGIYFYLSNIEKVKLYSPKLSQTHLLIFILTGIGIYFSLISGNMGGREYLEFLPILTIPILLAWILFTINYFKTLVGHVKDWPVYYWMWAVGITFMIYHLSEAHFWIFNSIRKDFIKDISIQWKSYGSFVGSWNMLVYGTAIYLMEKIKNDENDAKSKKSFFFFFLGLTNLMFGWAHHTYIIPSPPWIRYVAYVISMTEWIIFVYIIYTWAKSLNKETIKQNNFAYRFLMASELWVFLNIILALLMSIPTINYYTHGTHITVAHSMGTTIGINSMILLASVSFIISKLNTTQKLENNKAVLWGFYILNVSLLFFWINLIYAGVQKAIWLNNKIDIVHSELHQSMSSIYLFFVISGSFVFIGLTLIALPMIKKLINV